MATRPFVPRADDEGSLGLPGLRWGDVQTTRLNGDVLPEGGLLSQADVIALIIALS